MNLNPSQFLLDHFDLLSKGRTLDVAMGKGGNALYLAEQGFEVEGVDIDEEAVNYCREEASKRNIIIKTEIADLNDYRISHNTYDLILCFNYLQRDLIPQMRDGLKEGGLIVYKTFLIDQHIKFGKPKHKEYCFEHSELIGFFEGFKILYYYEGPINEEKIMANLIAQKGNR